MFLLETFQNSIKIFNKITISYETVRKSLILLDNLYYINKDFELSGYYSYDVQ